MNELFPTPFNAPYNEVLISAAAGSGKTVTATISILYDIYKLGCLKDPCEFYRLAPGTMIIMAIFSATAATTKVNWEEITQGITACPWIMRRLRDKRGVERKIGPIVPVEVIPGIYVQTGSKFQHSMGKAIFDGLMDEAAFGGANKNDAQKSYNELSSRIKTRFAKWGTKGNTPGQLFLISSPKEAGDFMQYRIEESQKADAKLTKILQNISTWDADPEKDSDDKFTVFIGNENKEPCIYEPDQEIPEEEMDSLLYVPMGYYEDFKKDLLISIMNYGGITTTNDMALFKSPTLLNESFILNNPFNMDVIELPFNKMDKTLMDFCDLSYFKNIRHPEANRFIHIDAAYSTETLDVYGLAAGYCIQDEITTFNSDAVVQKEDLFTKKDRTFFVDFAVGITAPKGQEVNLGKVQDFIEYLIKNMNYPVSSISADQFQSKQTLQNLENKGFNTDYISVDRTRDPYLFLRYLIHNKQIMIAKNDYLKGELRKLRDDGKKVDHPVGCARGDMVIKLLDGKNMTIKELADLGPDNEFWVYACKQDGTIVPAKAYNAHKTRVAKDLIEITLDNGKKCVFTPEHLFMLRNGQYIEAQNLKVGDSLMPLRYIKYKKYEIIWDNKTNKKIPTHQMVYRNLHGDYDGKTHVIHHCNVTPSDNRPENLQLMAKEDHIKLHFVITKCGQAAQRKLREEDPTWQQNINNKLKLFWNSEEGKKRRQECTKKAKKTWENKTPEEMQQIVEKFHNSLTPEIRQKISKRGQELNSVYWQSEEGKKRRQELSKTQLREASKIAYKNAYERRLEEYNKIKDKLDFEHGLSYKHVAQQIGYTKDTSTTIARAIEENHPFDFKSNIINLFEKYNFTVKEAREYFNCNGSTLTYYLRKYNIEYLVKEPEFNHKVKEIKWLYDVNEDVYDITVPEYHNFALENGIFVHNSHKDVADAVAGCIWNCANSNEIMNKAKIAQSVLNPTAYSPVQSQSVELVEFERLKQQFANGIFKGLK